MLPDHVIYNIGRSEKYCINDSIDNDSAVLELNEILEGTEFIKIKSSIMNCLLSTLLFIVLCYFHFFAIWLFVIFFKWRSTCEFFYLKLKTLQFIFLPKIIYIRLTLFI